MDLALNNLQRLICHNNQPTNQPTKGFKRWSTSALNNPIKIDMSGKKTKTKQLRLKLHFKSVDYHRRIILILKIKYVFLFNFFKKTIIGLKRKY